MGIFDRHRKLQPYTGKSFSEPLILASTNPQYDKRLFIELQFTVYLLLSKVHFSDLFEGQHYLKKIYIN